MTDPRSAVDGRSALLSHRGALTKVRFDPPGFDDRDTDLFLCDTNTCKFDGECLRIGNMVTCICDFKVRPVFFSVLFLFSGGFTFHLCRSASVHAGSLSGGGCFQKQGPSFLDTRFNYR